jgi:hypothetical protein
VALVDNDPIEVAGYAQVRDEAEKRSTNCRLSYYERKLRVLGSAYYPLDAADTE